MAMGTALTRRHVGPHLEHLQSRCTDLQSTVEAGPQRHTVKQKAAHSTHPKRVPKFLQFLSNKGSRSRKRSDGSMWIGCP